MKLYRCNRHMIGDKQYAPGDTIELDDGLAATLLKSGAVSEIEASKPVIAQKMEPQAQENKAALPPKNNKGR